MSMDTDETAEKKPTAKKAMARATAISVAQTTTAHVPRARESSSSDHKTHTDTAPGNESLGAVGTIFAVLFWLFVLGVFALNNDTSRAWIVRHQIMVGLLAVAAVGISAAVFINNRLKTRQVSVRAGVLLFVGYSLHMIGMASVFFFLPAQWQLVALRGLILLAFIITPALMWWLFLAAQRASLLNEFIANVQRLGLLERQHVDGHVETSEARAIRVSSYLQRFEGTYGRLPDKIHQNAMSEKITPYSSHEEDERPPLATAAVPVFLTITVFSIGWLLTLPPIEEFPASTSDTPRWLLALSPNLTPVTVAFLGAYFFSVQMLFRRYVRADLRGSAYVAVSLRVALAVIGIWVIEALGTSAGWDAKAELLLLAFIIGVFPMVVWQVIRGAASRVFRIFLPTLRSRLPLDRLDGLTVWHESRLEEEDIENVPNMATADIVDLLVNTRFAAGRIIDWIDQAILLTQLGPDQADPSDPNSARSRLASHGVRTASSLLKNVADREADGSIEEFARVVLDRDERPVIPSLVSGLQTSNNLPLVLRWRGLDPVTPVAR